MDIVLNELSLQSPATDATIARQWMSDFIQTIKSIKAQVKQQVILRTQYEFCSAVLAPNYPIRLWLNDQEVDREEQRFIKTLITKAPFSEDILNIEVQNLENQTGLSEFLYEGKVALGLGVAHILESIAISLRSAPCWDCSYLEIDIIWIDKDDEKSRIMHASRTDHLKNHISWFESWLSRQDVDGLILWDKREELFPHLTFCDSVEDQLLKLRTGNVMVQPIQKRLSDLQKYAESWLTGAFSPEKISCKATPESEATLQKYAQERTFLCPDGQNRVFSWHVRLTPLAWRIYFHPSQARQIIIGYIGPHLRTATFN